MKPRRWILLAALGVAALLWASRERPERSPRSSAPTFEADPDLMAALRAGDFPEDFRHRLSGRVVREGEPAAKVMIAAIGEQASAFTWTREDGSFVLDDLRRGEVELILVAPLAPNLVTQATVPSQGTLLLELPPAFPEVEMIPTIVREPLSGRVEIAFDESPEGLEVLLIPDTRAVSPAGTPGWAAALEGRVLRSVVCDEEGRFEFEDLAVGAYNLAVLPRWAEGGEWPILIQRSLIHGPDSAPLELRCHSGRMTGFLREPNGTPISGARIEVRDAGRPERLWPATFSDAGGGFMVSALPEGTYRISVTTGSAHVEQVLRVSALRTSEVDFGPLELFDSTEGR